MMTKTLTNLDRCLRLAVAVLSFALGSFVRIG